MILITGGFGFQGHHLVKSLLDDGYAVRVLARDSGHANRNYHLLLDYLSEEGTFGDIRVQWGDITNYETVRSAMRDCSLVVHLAAQINVDESRDFPERSVSVNFIGTFNILEAAKQQGGVKVIIGSTCEVYGSNTTNTLMKETHSLNPASPYAATKTGADRLAYSYIQTYGMPIVIVRPGNVYGWGQKSGVNGGVIPKWMELAKRGEPLQVFGSGEQGRDWVYIDDVIAGYRMIIEKFDKVKGETFNLGTGLNTAIKDIAEIISALGEVSIIHTSQRPGEVKSFALDSSKAYDKLDWVSRVNIDNGLWYTWNESKVMDGF